MKMSVNVSATPPLILVLLPVYNGEQFLAEQLHSILGQTHKNIRIMMRDDGSSDHSPDVVAEYAARYPQQIQMVRDDKGNLGAAAGFSLLMQLALSAIDVQPEQSQVYFALADQDDVWHPEKLDTCLQRLLREETATPGLPLLVHSDLRVVDRAGTELAPSLMRFQGLNPERCTFPAQLVSNTVTGCTTLMNRPLLEKALPVPSQAMMHDWWLSLVASCFGRLCYINAALADYRQHGLNTIGAKEHQEPGFNLTTLARLLHMRPTAQAQALFEGSAAQARAFAARYADELDEAQRTRIDQVVSLPEKGLWGQRILFRRLQRSSA